MTHLPPVTVSVQVEGEELEVLRGLDKTCWTRVQQVALEVHDCIDGEQQPSFGNGNSCTAGAVWGRSSLSASQQQQQQTQCC